MFSRLRRLKGVIAGGVALRYGAARHGADAGLLAGGVSGVLAVGPDGLHYPWRVSRTNSPGTVARRVVVGGGARPPPPVLPRRRLHVEHRVVRVQVRVHLEHVQLEPKQWGFREKIKWIGCSDFTVGKRTNQEKSF